MKQFARPSRSWKTLASSAVALFVPLTAQAITYDFVWYSGASQTWVYEVGPMLTVDVYEDSTTPEMDVYFKVSNNINTPLGYQSSIVDLQIDTGTSDPAMFSSISVSGYSGDVKYALYPPGSPSGLIDSAASRINWTGNYAAGRINQAAPKTDGVNPGEYVTLKAILNAGYSFADVAGAMSVGMSTTYVDGIYSTWTTAEKATYRSGAATGLRMALLVHSIVPNTWNPDGHGLFVTHSVVAVPEPETWVMMLAGLGMLGFMLRTRKPHNV